MKEKNDSGSAMISIYSPLTGNTLPVEQVPDPVFSEKILGDGTAVQPENGRIVSPVDGRVASVAPSLHAYGFETEDGVEVLVHFGLETAALDGEYFTSYVQPGDKVKAGDLVAEAELDRLKARGIDTITPVLICAGAEGRKIQRFLALWRRERPG